MAVAPIGKLFEYFKRRAPPEPSPPAVKENSLDHLVSDRSAFEADCTHIGFDHDYTKDELGEYVNKDTKLAWSAYRRIQRELLRHTAKKNRHSHYLIGRKTESGLSFLSKPKVYKTLEKAVKTQLELQERFGTQFNIYGKVYVTQDSVQQQDNDSSQESV